MANDILPSHKVSFDASRAQFADDHGTHARLIDRDEFARRLAVGVSTLDRLRAAGMVGPHAIRFGGVRFLLAEVAAWLSTPAASGELHDAKSWPAVWSSLQKQAGKAGH